jgi:transposase
MAFKRGEPRVCSMARAPTPQEEDRRRVCRERRTLMGERVKHVNRIKGLLFAQGVFGYEPLRKGRRERLEDLRTGDGRPLPMHLKAQIIRELDRLEVLLEQLKTVEAERDALLKPASAECGPLANPQLEHASDSRAAQKPAQFSASRRCAGSPDQRRAAPR